MQQRKGLRSVRFVGIVPHKFHTKRAHPRDVVAATALLPRLLLHQRKDRWLGLHVTLIQQKRRLLPGVNIVVPVIRSRTDIILLVVVVGLLLLLGLRRRFHFRCRASYRRVFRWWRSRRFLLRWNETFGIGGHCSGSRTHFSGWHRTEDLSPSSSGLSFVFVRTTR